MEKLSLFRAVSNAAVSGILSHTQSDGAETLLVGWARKKKSCFVNVILCNQVSNTSEAVLPMTPQWYHGFTKLVWKQQIIARSQKRILRKEQKRKHEIRYLPVLPKRQLRALQHVVLREEVFRGKPPEQSSWAYCWELLSRPSLTHKLATLFPPLALSYLLITFGFYSVTFKYAE